MNISRRQLFQAFKGQVEGEGIMTVNRRDFFKGFFGSIGLFVASKAQATFGLTETVKVEGLEAHDGARLEGVTIEGMPVNVVGKGVLITRCIFKNSGDYAIKVGH